MMAKALRFDNEMRSVTRSGFSHDLFSFLSQFFDVSEVESLTLDDFTYLQDLRYQLLIQHDDVFRSSFRRSSGLNFYADLSDDVRIPSGLFGEFLGTLEYEIARIVILFMGDVFRYSLSVGSSRCPFCPVELHAQHLFLCQNCPFHRDLPVWSLVIQSFRVCDWATFVHLILSGFYIWQTHTNFFRPISKDRVSAFLGHDIGR
jgi:hypothetical protein